MTTGLAITELEEQAEEIIDLVLNYVDDSGRVDDYLALKQVLINYLDRVKENY